MKSGSSELLSSIQILRGVAAAMVLFYHLPDFIGLASPTFLSTGVDLFFVISGFVIMISTMHKRDDVQGFIWKRLMRIVPLYWLVTLGLVLVWGLTGGHELRVDQIAMSLLFVPYLDTATGYIQPTLAVGWTLNLELCFYALFAASMFLRPAVQFVTLTVLFVVLIAGRAMVGADAPTALAFYATPLLLEFAAGMALALALPRLRSMPGAAGVGLVLAGGLAMIVFGRDLGLPRELAQGAPALLIVAGVIAIEPWLRARALAPLHLLGDASYALYLIHLPVLTSLRPLLAGWSWWLAGLLMLGACILTALVLHRLVERPLLRWARSGPVAQPQPVAD